MAVAKIDAAPPVAVAKTDAAPPVAVPTTDAAPLAACVTGQKKIIKSADWCGSVNLSECDGRESGCQDNGDAHDVLSRARTCAAASCRLIEIGEADGNFRQCNKHSRRKGAGSAKRCRFPFEQS